MSRIRQRMVSGLLFLNEYFKTMQILHCLANIMTYKFTGNNSELMNTALFFTQEVVRENFTYIVLIFLCFLFE